MSSSLDPRGVDEQRRCESNPRLHIACIMDGNGRWAGQHGLPRTAGHTEGEENLARIVRLAVPRDVGWLTVFGFSTENWIRPRAEVRHILGLHEKLFGRINELNELNVRIQWIGRPFDSPTARTPKYVQRAIRKAIADTAGNTGMVLTVAFDYGSRAELMAAVSAARTAGRVTPEAIDANLYLPELPPVDVMVRTSGERRVSNFLLWQSTGSKIHFTDSAWPDFDAADLDAADRARPMTHDDAASAVTPSIAALDAVTAALPVAELRNGQRVMAKAVADAIDSGRHLVVQAGTGTGKTLAYLVPAIVSGKRTIVATATKALQDQLATKDLPFVVAQLAEHGIDADWAVLKGRSNYLCLQRLREFTAPAQTQLELEPMSVMVRAEITRLAEWAGRTRTGDAAELDWSPSDAAWRSVSVGGDECPGADKCPMGRECFAELARDRAQVSDVVVVNTHLYGIDVAALGAIMPEHDVIVFDEAHGLEDIMSDTVGIEIAPGRFLSVSAAVRGILSDADLVGSIADLASEARHAFSDYSGQRLRGALPDPIVEFLEHARLVLVRTSEILHGIETSNEEAQQRRLRALAMLTRTSEYVDAALSERQGSVAFVSGSPDNPRLEIAPLDVGPTMRSGVWDQRTAILTSATIPSSLVSRVGLPAEATDQIDVGSPFHYESQAMLYCAMKLPPPKSPRFRDAVADELVELIGAAGGRTLALFTSWAALDHAVAAVRDRVDVPILSQRDLPKPALVNAFASSAETCLFATTGLFQGVDVPGATLSLVVIDKLPFPRPDDPLLSARRELLGAAAFDEIDVPRAATMLAQACGRLIRTADDRGAVAVLDSRLGSARYRWDIVRALPPMKRTRDRDEVAAFLRELRREDTVGEHA